MLSQKILQTFRFLLLRLSEFGLRSYLLTLLPINSLPNEKILDCSKSKVFADDKIKVLKMIIFVLDRVENIVRKGESAGYHGYQHFLLFA